MCLKILVLLLGMLLVANSEIEPQEVIYRSELEQIEAGNKEEVIEEAVFGSVPYFRDDTGKDAQLVDGYLYGYWNGRLCRYDVNNNYAEQILFDAGCNQAGSFCISDGVIYFLTRPVVSTITNENTCLYKMNCDGNGLVLLQDKIADIYYDWGNYEIDIYDNIIYLWNPHNMSQKVFYRLTGKDEVENVPMKSTLYGQLPEGYREATRWGLPSLIYMVRNYGFVFLEKEDNEGLYLCNLETAELKEVCLKNNIYPYKMFLTNDKLIFWEWNKEAFVNQWYWVSLDDLENPQKWIMFGNTYQIEDEFFYDEQGVYFVRWDYNMARWELWYADWKSETAFKIVNYLKKEGPYDTSPVHYGGGEVWYFDGEAIYYNEDGGNYDKKMYGKDCIIRQDLKGNAQIINIYNDTPDYGRELCYNKKEELSYSLADGVVAELEKNLSGLYGDGSLLFTMDKVYLRGDTAAIHKINDFLKGEYDAIEEEWMEYAVLWESLMTENMENVDLTDCEWIDLTGTDMEASAGICYSNEKYIVFCISEGGYWSGAAHPNYYYKYYVFDRVTGERLGFDDIAGKSKEEIYEIVVPYLEKDYGNKDWWNYSEYYWILDDDRLFLTKEGIGIFFNRYDIDCYAAGEIEYVIPYEAFE